MMDKRFKISLFSNRYARIPISHEVSRRDLGRGLLMPAVPYPVTQKNTLPLWSPTIFDGSRSGANARFISRLVFDMDDGTDRAFHNNFLDYDYLFHTSFSHTESHHKYRVILPLQNPIPAQDWKRAAKAAKEFWDLIIAVGEPDSNALTDCARMYYRFAHPDWGGAADLHQVFDNHTGNYFDLDYSHIPIEAPKIVRRYQRWTPRKEGQKMGMEALFHNPEFRMGVANKAGANIEGNMARGIRCPGCGENEVYFSIDPSLPHAVLWPHCNRANNCRWWGKMEDLL